MFPQTEAEQASGAGHGWQIVVAMVIITALAVLILLGR
jgi:hypothetical protein